MNDLVLYNAKIFTAIDSHNSNSNLNTIVVNNGKIVELLEVKSEQDLKKIISNSKSAIDVKNKWVTPGLIDCHTHLVFAGDRQTEFTDRLGGKSYEEIAKQGGGINFTVSKTREASFDELLSLAENRLKQMISNGVTTVEIKSGYGLDFASEKKILQVINHLAKNYPVTIQRTFLGAHTVPKEFKNKPEQYIDYLITEVLPDLVKNNLIDAIDSFCEKIAFTAEQLRPLYEKAQEYGLLIKGHTEQLAKIGGAELICEFNGLSCDHLEYADQNIIKLMKKHGITAVLLPGAYYYLGQYQLPPINLLREAKIPMAIGTDFNPGTSPVISLITVMNMACVLFKLAPIEVWQAVTINAARALGMSDRVGSIELNKNADLIIWDFNHPYDLCYYLGYNFKKTIIKNGEVLNGN